MAINSVGQCSESAMKAPLTVERPNATDGTNRLSFRVGYFSREELHP